MSSRCPDSGLKLPALIVLTAALILSACQREERRFSEAAPASATADSIRQSALQLGVPADSASASAYEFNAFTVSEGQRLFNWFNCSGCHGNGGGGAIGPPLIDDQWIYGSAPENIYATIVEGRPNGMPSFGGRLPRQQVWQLVAYVRSLAGKVPRDVMSSRADHMQPKKVSE